MRRKFCWFTWFQRSCKAALMTSLSAVLLGLTYQQTILLMILGFLSGTGFDILKYRKGRKE